MTIKLASPPITAEAVEKLAAQGIHTEIIAGQWVNAIEDNTMAVGKRHSLIGARLITALMSYLADYSIGQVYQDGLGYVLKGSPSQIELMYMPDVSFVQSARIVQENPDSFYYQAPDIAIEIISPSEGAEEIQEKLDNYLDYGTGQVWQVYPKQQKVMIYFPDGRAVSYRPGQIIEENPLLPDFRLEVSKLFD